MVFVAAWCRAAIALVAFTVVNLCIFNVLWAFYQVGFGALPEASGRLIANLVVAIMAY